MAAPSREGRQARRWGADGGFGGLVLGCIDADRNEERRLFRRLHNFCSSQSVHALLHSNRRFSFAQHPFKNNQFFFGNVRTLFRDVATSSVATPHSPPTNPASPPPTSLESQMLEFAAQVGTDERALHQIIKMGNVCGHVRVMRFVTLCKIEEMMVDAKKVAKVAVTSDWLPPQK